jgi:ribosomal protein S18 acetylase RimI-like enzyme
VTIDVRRADVADAEVLSALGGSTFSDTFGYLFAHVPQELDAHVDHSFSVEATRAGILVPENQYVLAFVDSVPAGYAKVIDGGETAQLERIYVAREFLDRSVGLPLLDASLDCARLLGASSLWLSVFQRNERAQRFYRKHGFLPYGDESYAIGSQTFDFYLMRKELG